MSEKLNLGDECCCCSPADWGFRKITFPDGSQEGIAGLETVMHDLFHQGKPADSSIGPEIFERLKSLNYLAASFRPQYEAAFLAEYQRFLERKNPPAPLPMNSMHAGSTTFSKGENLLKEGE